MELLQKSQPPVLVAPARIIYGLSERRPPAGTGRARARFQRRPLPHQPSLKPPLTQFFIFVLLCKQLGRLIFDRVSSLGLLGAKPRFQFDVMAPGDGA